MRTGKNKLYLLSAACLSTFILFGCGKDSAPNGPGGPGGPGGGMPPPEVGVVTVTKQPVAISTELPGRVEATREAEVRARIPGIVLKRVFREGSLVRAGEVLFRIDPAPLRAVYNNAQAAVSRAEANLTQATLRAQRYQPLLQTNAISKQEYDDAVAAQKQAAADVASAKAQRETARLNLGYATVIAPISGRIGRAQVTEGALVGQGEATPLATIQQLDPIYVNLTQSSSEVLRLRQSLAKGELASLAPGEAKVTLVMEDNSVYPHTGRLLFSDLTVDQSTGAITLRAEFPNPGGLLLPGMYVRARLQQAVERDAILVPQQAVTRTPDGASVMVVGQDGKVAPRPIKTGSVQGDNWVIEEGLQPGEQVIVEGLQKAQPGAPVKPVPWKQAVANNATAAPIGTAQSAAPPGSAGAPTKAAPSAPAKPAQPSSSSAQPAQKQPGK